MTASFSGIFYFKITVCWSKAPNSYSDDGTGEEVGQGKWPQRTEASTMVSKKDCKLGDEHKALNMPPPIPLPHDPMAHTCCRISYGVFMFCFVFFTKLELAGKPWLGI